MAPARVRGCVGPIAPRGAQVRQADASRRRNGPRKATSRRPITVRLRSKSCPDGGPDGLRPGRRGVVAVDAARPSAGGCGVEDQVGRAGARPSVPTHGSDDVEDHFVDIVVKGRNTEVAERFRQHATEKLAKIEKLDAKVISIDVECSQGAQPTTRRPARGHRADDPLPRPGRAGRGRCAGLLRRARPRGRQAGEPAAPGPRPAQGAPRREDAGVGRGGHRRPGRGHRRTACRRPPTGSSRGRRSDCDRGVARRRARCSSARRSTTPIPMDLDQALYEMELVGHDFFLFVDAESAPPERGLPAPRLPVRRDPAGAPEAGRRVPGPPA